MPAIEDAMVSIRAIGCRRDIADKIIAQKRITSSPSKERTLPDRPKAGSQRGR
jgi:hypothetical protein